MKRSRAFEAGDVLPAAFGHRAHLRVAWVYLREAPSVEAAVDHMRSAIRRVAAAAGASQKYHETITVLWMRLPADVRSQSASGELADALHAYPELADKDLPLRFYTPERLFGDEARAGWVEPDRHALGVIAS